MDSLFLPKLVTVLRKGYTRDLFLRDLRAGTIVGMVALPLAIAFAIASGVSPEKGLITAVVAGFLVSLLGGSRVQIGGPTGALVVIIAGIIGTYGMDGLIISTIMAGIIMILFGLLKLGSIIRFVPYPLTVGFTSGIAVLIFTSQIKDFLGLNTGDLPIDFLGKVELIGQNLHTANLAAIGIALLSIFVSVYWSRVTTKVPGLLIAILLSVALDQIFNLDLDTIGSRFGEISPTIQFPAWPNFNADLIIKHIAPAFTIAILGSIVSLLSAVVTDSMISSRHRSNTELIAQGIANIAGAIFGGIPATGAIGRAATNVKNGARTPIAGIVHAIVLLIIIALTGKWVTYIPLSCLAGILVVLAYNMSEWRSFIGILKGSRYDILVLLSVFILTVIVNLTVAIQIGMILAALLFMKRMADVGEVKPMISYQSEEEDDNLMSSPALPKNVDVYEITGPMFFGVANKFKEVMHNIADHAEIIIIRMRNVPLVDATGIHNFNSMLRTFIHQHKHVMLSGVNPEVHKELKRYGIVALLGEENICSTFDEALSKVAEFQKMDFSEISK